MIALDAALPRLQARLKQVHEQEDLTAWTAEAAELQERRLAMGTKFGKEYPDLMNPILNQLWAMRALDKEINELNRRRPDSANARPADHPSVREVSQGPRPRCA